jgi:hypothetical protein
MHSQATVDEARTLCAQGLYDREVAALTGVPPRDGGRGMNRVRRRLKDGDPWYEYPRYQFSNKSHDILGLCGATLDRLGVEWRLARPDVISVAKRDSVARLGAFVGPKH